MNEPADVFGVWSQGACERAIDEFRAGIDRSAATEAELRQLEAQPTNESIEELERSLAAHEAAYAAACSERQQAASNAVQAAAAEYRRDTEAAKAEYRETVGQLWEDHQNRKTRTVEQCDERSWVTNSIVDDDSEASPKKRYETTKGQIERTAERLSFRLDELQHLHEQAAKQLPDAVRKRAESVPVDLPRPQTLVEAYQAFENAASIVERQAGVVNRQGIFKTFGPAGSSFMAVVVAGGIFASVYFGIDPASIGLRNLSGTQWLLACAVPALLLGIAVGSVLFTYARSRLVAAFTPLIGGYRTARHARKLWETSAFRELDERREILREYEATSVTRREQALKRYAAERDEQLELIDRELREFSSEAERLMDRRLQEFTTRYETLSETIETDRVADLRQMEAEYVARRDDMQFRLEQLTDGRRSRTEQLRRHLSQQWDQARSRLVDQAGLACRQAAAQFDDWTPILSTNWKPAADIPAGIPLGTYIVPVDDVGDLSGFRSRGLAVPESVRLPAVYGFPQACSLLFKTPEAGRDAVTHALQVLTLRLFTQLPPGTARFTFIDPLGLGENFSTFMHLNDYDELLVTHRSWTEPHHIEAQLAKLTEHIENVFQKYLRNDFPSIEAYNHHAGEVAEPYRFLVVSGFPSGFTERAAQRLMSVAASGPRCGVYPLIQIDPRQPLPRGFQFDDFEQHFTTLTWKDGRLRSTVFGLNDVPLELDPLPPPADFTAIVKRVGEHSRDTRRVEVPFARIAPAPGESWTADSRRGLEIPLGRSGATKLQSLRLGSGTSQHALVAGRTGSGKSTLLHVMIVNAALRYSPDELEFYLIDFKKGVEFKPYASGLLPHARVVAIESDREFGVSVLERLDALLKERGELFRERGVQDVAAYRQACPDALMPRILLLVDEFQEFFVEDDTYSQTASLLLDRLVRQGRAFGVHVLLGSQTLGGAYSLARTTISQMGVRIALQCSDTDAHLILSEDNTAARLLTRPGEAIYNDANGMIEGNSTFQVAWLSDEQQREHLERLTESAAAADRDDLPPVVFEGNQPADILRNPAVTAGFHDSIVNNSTVDRGNTHGTGNAVTADVRLWLGDPVAIAPPTSVLLRRLPGHNLCIVASESRSGAELAATALLGTMPLLLANAVEPEPEPEPESGTDARPAPLATYTVLADDASATEPWQLLAGHTDAVQLISPVAASEMIGRFSAELAERQSDPQTRRPPKFLVVSGLEYFDALRKSDDDYGFGSFDKDQAPSPSRQFSALIKDGPVVGIHTVIVCVSYNTFDRWLGRNMLREFGHRLAFQLSATDSSLFIDSPLAGRLGPNRALLYRDQQGTTEKFRPYVFPAPESLTALFEPAAAPLPDDGNLEVPDSLDAWQIV